MTVRAYLVVEAVKDLFWLPGSIVYNRSVRFLCRDKGSATFGAGIACIPVDDEVGGLLCVRAPSMPGMAKNCPSFLVRLIFGSIIFEGRP